MSLHLDPGQPRSVSLGWRHGGGAEEEGERQYRNSAIETYSNLYGELIVIEAES